MATVDILPGSLNQSGISAADLRQDLLTHRVHLSEINRRIFGADTDLDVIAGALSSAHRGYMVDLTDLENEALSYDPHVLSLAFKRFGQLRAADWDVTPPQGVSPSDRKYAVEIADMVGDIYRRIGISQAIYDTAWALCHARSASEVHWANGAWGYRFAPYSIDWVHPRRLCFGAFRELRVVDTNHQTMTFTSQHGIPVEEIPGKFIYWKPRLFAEYPEREGLGPRSMYWTFFKRFNQRMRMKLTELFGMPWRIVTVDKDAPANPESIKQAKLDAEDLGGETTAAFDRGVDLNVEWPGENSGELMTKSHEQINAELSKLWSGNTATTDQSSGSGGGGANRANGIIGKGEQDIIFQCDGTGLSERWTKLAYVITEMNYGPGALHLAPIFQLRTQPQRDRDKELGRVQVALGMGLAISESEVREISGYRAPLPDEVYFIGKSAGTDATGKPLPPIITIVDPAKTPEDMSPKAAPNSNAPALSEPSEPTPGESPKGLPGGEPTKQPTPKSADGAEINTEPEDDPDARLIPAAEEKGVDGSAAAAIKDLLGLARRFTRAGIVLDFPFPPLGESVEAVKIENRITHESDGWHVYSEDGKTHLGGPYETKGEAVDRLAQVEGHKEGVGEYDAQHREACRHMLDRNPQPSAAIHGSPETLISRGTTAGARETQKLAHAFAQAATGDSAMAIRGALARVEASASVDKLARQIEMRIAFGLMLGALDADWEAVNDRVVKPPTFDIGLEREGVELASHGSIENGLTLAEIGPGGGVVDFVSKPFAEAMRLFNAKKVVTKPAFERMLADGKKRAFTVANLAKKAMVETAKDELSKALEDGDDLRRFSARLNERFDAAGWTKMNPSHVETVFRNATMGAYADGRDAQMSQPHVLAARPYWQVMGVKDDRTRETHGKAQGKVLRADDGFWKRAPLPWGHNCRCRKVSRSEDDVKRLGLQVVSGGSLSGLPDKGWNSSSSDL